MKTTQLTNPAKAYAQGVGNAVPDIPDPIAGHATTGTLKLKVTAEQGTGNVMIGMLQPAPTVAPVVVGASTPAAAAPMPTPTRRNRRNRCSTIPKATSITASSRR
ncbi:hypothetical protein AK51_03605 [Serratia nematodiphila DZ0503SBS1]|nr:hypothetical protein AK51_03605 [Serratia nematodiphila DZ0503SBS1]